MTKASLTRRLLLLPMLALVALASGTYLQGYVALGHAWGSDTVRYYVNPRNKWVSESAAISAIQTAAAGWSEQSRANIQLTYAGQTAGSSLTLNNKNEVFFRDAASSAGNVAEAWYWWDGTGRLVDADIIFYEVYQFFAGSGCVNGIYIENVGIHEFGHALGLRHSELSGVTMQTAMQSYCDTSQLTLEPDDIAGIESIYRPLSGGSTSNTAPSVSISAPGNNESYSEGTALTFSGSASDTQDGNVTASLRWTSNLAGQIGTGASFSRTLSAGTHVITAAVSDSGGMSSSKQVTVTVTATTSAPPPSPNGAVLAARGYKVKGQQKVDLTWSGLSGPTVDVYRNGTKVASVTNSGAGTDPINSKGGGSYVYKVCEAGNSNCSNTANVNF